MSWAIANHGFDNQSSLVWPLQKAWREKIVSGRMKLDALGAALGVALLMEVGLQVC